MKGYLDSRKWLATGSWASVNSKTVKGIRYDRKSRRLFIESSKGVVMSYEGVHPMTARACFNSKLIPKFVAKRLLRKYLCSRHNLSPMEKTMKFPNDPDGGGRRVAAIQMVERKITMAEKDGDETRAERYRQQLAELNDPNKPVK